MPTPKFSIGDEVYDVIALNRIKIKNIFGLVNKHDTEYLYTVERVRDDFSYDVKESSLLKIVNVPETGKHE